MSNHQPQPQEPPPWAGPGWYAPPWAAPPTWWAGPPPSWAPLPTAPVPPVSPAAPVPTVQMPPGAPPPAGRPPIPSLAAWDVRACATLLDIAVVAGAETAYGYTLAMVSPLMHIVLWLAGQHYSTVIRDGYWIIALAWAAWQWSLRGRTGQSLGQRLMGVSVVDAATCRPIGAGRSILRSLTHVLDIAPMWAGYARPVWHARRQTFADSIHHTVAIAVPSPAGKP
jgi:uncharacterized RDD family membrane protein YckC